MSEIPSSVKWANALDMLLNKLPDYEHPHWTKEYRRKWMIAMEAIIDDLIEVYSECEVITGVE